MTRTRVMAPRGLPNAPAGSSAACRPPGWDVKLHMAYLGSPWLRPGMGRVCFLTAVEGRMLLPEPRPARETHRILGGPEQGFCFVDALLLLRGGVGIEHDAGAGLNRHPAVLHHGRAQDDAGVHLPIRTEIAD